MPYRLSGHFYATPVITDRTPHHRCPACRLLLSVEPINLDTTFRATTGDLCATSDGFWIATAKFKRVYDEEKLEGADFLPLSSKQFIFLPRQRVRLHRTGSAADAHGPICEACGNPRYHLANRFDLALDERDHLGDRDAALGSRDFIMEVDARRGAFIFETILVGDAFAAAMRGKRMRGLAFNKLISPIEYDAAS